VPYLAVVVVGVDVLEERVCKAVVRGRSRGSGKDVNTCYILSLYSFKVPATIWFVVKTVKCQAVAGVTKTSLLTYPFTSNLV